MQPDARTAVVLMSHNYLRDIAYLGSFLGAGLAYLGVLGPRGRTEQMLGELGQPEALGRLHAPAGLDIGAEGPEEVARAIVAEILAVTRGRAGGPLRERAGPIHWPTRRGRMAGQQTHRVRSSLFPTAEGRRGNSPVSPCASRPILLTVGSGRRSAATAAWLSNADAAGELLVDVVVNIEGVYTHSARRSCRLRAPPASAARSRSRSPACKPGSSAGRRHEAR